MAKKKAAAKAASTSSTKEVDEGKICALLAYFFPIGLIWYLADPNMKRNKFAAWHVYQSLAAAIAVIVGMIVGAILTLILIGIIIQIIVWILGLVWFLQGIIYSLGGQKKELWLLGNLAKQFNF